MARTRPWSLALALALLAPAPLRADHWAPEEITDKFKEVDDQLAQLKALVRFDRAASRRLVALEGEVRDMRSRLNRLETKLDSLAETLHTIRLELAKDAATRAAAARVEEKVAARGSSDQGRQAADGGQATARVVDRHSTVEGGFITIAGTVENVSDAPLSFVVVKAQFLDADDNVVKTESAYTSPRVIGPGDQATFRINTRRDRRIRANRLLIETK
ncbi:MAG: FxLYD domain-containing protein [Candidatus Brocadiia bacterium]